MLLRWLRARYARYVVQDDVMSDAWLTEQRSRAVRNVFDGVCWKWPIVK